jgi:hypothetical protein
MCLNVGCCKTNISKASTKTKLKRTNIWKKFVDVDELTFAIKISLKKSD